MAKKIVRADGTSVPGAGGLRISCCVMWILAIVAEIIAILILNGTIYVPDDNFTMWLLIPLAVDFVLVIVAGQLWKKANDRDPASEKNKFKFFLQNQLGMIMALICFVPFIVLLLSNKKLEKGTKKLVSIVAVIMLIVAGLFSFDWNPASAEDLAAAEDSARAAGKGNVYWTTFGKSYHYDEECHTLSRSSKLYTGTISEAFEANRSDPCDFCVKQLLTSDNKCN